MNKNEKKQLIFRRIIDISKISSSWKCQSKFKFSVIWMFRNVQLNNLISNIWYVSEYSSNELKTIKIYYDTEKIFMMAFN